LKRGFVHVYTGNGKGKTTAAVGLSVRAVGWGLKVSFIQFLKGRPTGEMKVLSEIPDVEFVQTGRPDYDFNPNEEDRKRVLEAMRLARERAGSVDLLVLDEVNVAVHLGLLPLPTLVNFIKEKPEGLELVLTGRWAKPEVIELADYVTYFELVKHPFYRGKPARRGIDY